ncbi:PHP domain-containing protein, partial [Pelagibacteraceae bacterium]|nr:PHP domain-containing protein [Pelagibacteraceae bacterium]
MAKTQKEFVNFKVHTQYSICEGAIKIDELSDYCKTNKVKSIGLCDNYNMCGALEFAEKISKVGTQPIIGTQINFEVAGIIGKLPLFAKSEAGYKNLISLSSKSYLKSDRKSDPHCKAETLESSCNELILLSGNQNDLYGKLFKLNKLKVIEQSIDKIQKIFKDRFYIEIQRHNDPGEKLFENYLIQLSNKFKLPLIASQETYYMKENMYEAHDALTCIG